MKSFFTISKCFLLIVYFLFIAPRFVSADVNGIWVPTGDLITKRSAHTATLLPNGKVLVVGGRTMSLNSQNPTGYLNSTEIFDINIGLWSFAGNLNSSRESHTATLLPNGKVLVVGGYNSTVLSSVELYDPVSNVWTLTGSLNTPRTAHIAVLLSSGKVLVAGGNNLSGILSDAEIYDPNIGAWYPVQSMSIKRNVHKAVLLPNGKPLIIGGHDQFSNSLSSVEVFDPMTETWSFVTSMSTPRINPDALLLQNGKVLVFGGANNITFTRSAEIYDFFTDTWTPTGSMTIERARNANVLLQNGEVLVVGGIANTSSDLTIQATAEIYNPITGSWILTQPMFNKRYFPQATLLQNGKVLVTGGSSLSSPLFSIAQTLLYTRLPDVSTPTPTPSPVTSIKDFKQTDPLWSTASNLPANVNTRLNHLLSCGDMYSFGCAVTSVADVFYSYGKTALSNTQLTPGTLNDWLTTHNGFTACSIIWANASSATQLGAPNIMFRNNSANWSAGQQAIDNALNIGNLPIVGVYTSFGTHFFVISEKLPDVNGKPNYKIVDPALYPFVTNNPGKTGQSLSQAYGGWDKVFETVIYKKGTSPQRTLTIRAHSPVHLYITDPLGNATGFDEATQEIMENIPDSTYGIEPGIAPVDGSSPAMEETKYFQQNDPVEGEYKIQLIGTGNGEYSLDFSKTDENGNVSTEVINGFAQTGVTEIYQVEYIPDASDPVIVEKQVTFDVLKTDLKVLYREGEIKNKGIYSLLKLQAEIAERASLMNKQPLGTKLAILVLKSFKFELNRHRGRFITEDAYQILYNDVESLIDQLQGTSEEPPEDPGGGS